MRCVEFSVYWRMIKRMLFILVLAALIATSGEDRHMHHTVMWRALAEGVYGVHSSFCMCSWQWQSGRRG